MNNVGSLGGSGFDRTVTVTPAPNQFSTTRITVNVTDGIDVSHRSFLLTVNSINDVPVVESASIAVPEDHPGFQIVLSAKHPDPENLAYPIVDKPVHGTLFLTSPPNQFTYRPARDYFGQDRFTFKANDGTSVSNIGTVSITVTPVRDKPDAGGRGHDVRGRKITVTPVRDKPDADAGPNQNVRPGDRVTLRGINSFDKDGDALRFTWTQIRGPQVTLTGTTQEKATFMAPGHYQFRRKIEVNSST